KSPMIQVAGGLAVHVHRDQERDRAGDRPCLVRRHHWLLEAFDYRPACRGWGVKSARSRFGAISARRRRWSLAEDRDRRWHGVGLLHEPGSPRALRGG